MTIIIANLPSLLLSNFQHTRVSKQTYLHSSKSDSWATRRSSCSPRFCFNFWVSLCPLDVIFLKYIFSLSIFKICCNLLMLSTIFLINLSRQVKKCCLWLMQVVEKGGLIFALCTTCCHTNSNTHNKADWIFNLQCDIYCCVICYKKIVHYPTVESADAQNLICLWFCGRTLLQQSLAHVRVVSFTIYAPIKAKPEGGRVGSGIGWGFWHFLKKMIKLPTPGQTVIVKIIRSKWFIFLLLFEIERSSAWCPIKIPNLGIYVAAKFRWVAPTSWPWIFAPFLQLSKVAIRLN